uniref:Uncharacterized protein n=1 Tax=Caenorhabditis japonica TaxID=281687 RepID=A0A8R1DRT9_CAEJA
MSHERTIQFFVENELAISREVCKATEQKMRYLYNLVSSLDTDSLPWSLVERIGIEFEEHVAIFDIVFNENDLYELKRITACMHIYCCFLATTCVFFVVLHFLGVRRCLNI